MQWGEQDLNRQRVEKLIAEATVGNGVLIFDDTGFEKKGQASVGVARQYSGTLGKVGNCQVAVTCGYADARASWPVSVCLYLRKEWTENPERMQRARVPSGVTFETKPQIALDLLDQARAWSVPHRGVTADADYGDNPHFLVGLEERHERGRHGKALGRHACGDSRRWVANLLSSMRMPPHREGKKRPAIDAW